MNDTNSDITLPTRPDTHGRPGDGQSSGTGDHFRTLAVHAEAESEKIDEGQASIGPVSAEMTVVHLCELALLKCRHPPANFIAAIQEEASFSRQPLDAGSEKETTICWIAPTFDTNIKAKYENPDLVSDLTAILALAASVPSAEKLAKKLSQHHEDGGLWHERHYGRKE